jgi:hypothetical protein
MHNKTIIFLLIFLLFLFSLPIWLIEYLPLTDYPNHLLRITMVKEYYNPNFNFSDYFILRDFPVPNLFSDYFILLFSYLVPIQIAGKIFITLYILLLPLSVFYFLSRVDRTKLYLGFFSFFFIYSFYFNDGFLNFCISIPVFFLTLGYWWRVRNGGSLKRYGILLLLSLLLYFSHVVAYCVLIWSIFVLSLADSFSMRKLFRNLAPFIPSLTLFVAYIGYVILFVKDTSFSFGSGYTGLFRAATNFLRFCFISFSKVEALIYAIPLLLYVIYLFRGVFTEEVFSNLKHLGRENKTRIEIRFLILMLSLFILYFLFPEYFGQFWWGINIRLVPFVFLLGLAAIPLPPAGRLFPKYVVPLLVSLMIYIPLHNWNWYRKFQLDFEDLVSGIDHFESNQTLLPLILDTARGSYNTYPFWHAWAYYHMAKGGAGPFLFADHQQITSYKIEFPRPSSPTFFTPQSFNIKHFYEFYEYVLIWGGEPTVERQTENYYSLVQQKGALKLYKKNKINATGLEGKSGVLQVKNSVDGEPERQKPPSRKTHAK